MRSPALPPRALGYGAFPPPNEGKSLRGDLPSRVSCSVDGLWPRAAELTPGGLISRKDEGGGIDR